MSSVWDIVGKLFKSKTLIVNWLTFVVGLGTYLTNDQLIAQYPGTTAAIVSAIAAINVVLRWLTVLPLSEK